MLYKTVGTLRYTTHWLMLDADQGIVDCYRALIPKYMNTMKTRPAHVTVKRYEEQLGHPEHWGKYDGEKVEFYYEPVIRDNGFYYWLNVFSERLDEVRTELGLPMKVTHPEGFKKCFHITIACKKHS